MAASARLRDLASFLRKAALANAHSKASALGQTAAQLQAVVTLFRPSAGLDSISGALLPEIAS